MINAIKTTSFYIRRAVDAAARNRSKTVKWETSLKVAEDIADSLDNYKAIKEVISEYMLDPKNNSSRNALFKIDNVINQR